MVYSCNLVEKTNVYTTNYKSVLKLYKQKVYKSIMRGAWVAQ